MSWPLIKFKEVATIVTGTTPEKNDKNYGGDIPFVTPGDLGSVSEIYEAKVMVTDSGAAEGRLLPVDTVLVCCIGATIGKVGIAKVPVITNQQINSLIFDSSIVYPKFAYYFCKTLTEVLMHKSTSTTMPIVNKTNFSEITIPLPPLKEQIRIASILDKADSIRRKRQEAIAMADEFLRSVFLDMFGDPVTNPKGWRIASLNEVSIIKGEYGSGSSAVSYADGDYRYIRITDITERGDLKEEKVGLSNSDTDGVKYQLKNGDLLFARTGATVGKTFLYEERYGKCAFAGYLIRFRFDEKQVLPEYIKAFTETGIYWDWIQSCQKVVAQPNINAKQYGEDLKIPIPPVNNQKEFIAVWKKIKSMKTQGDSFNREALLESLSQKAFSGDL